MVNCMLCVFYHNKNFTNREGEKESRPAVAIKSERQKGTLAEVFLTFFLHCSPSPQPTSHSYKP